MNEWGAILNEELDDVVSSLTPPQDIYTLEGLESVRAEIHQVRVVVRVERAKR